MYHDILILSLTMEEAVVGQISSRHIVMTDRRPLRLFAAVL